MRRRPGAHGYRHLQGAVVAAGICAALGACSDEAKTTIAAEEASDVTVIARSSNPVVERELPGLTVLQRIDPSAARPAAGNEAFPRGGGHYKLGKPYQIGGDWYTPQEDPSYDQVGRASWYGKGFHGRMTANGEIFDARALTAAHPTLPLPSYVRVTNIRNNRSIVVRVNDRGPYKYKRLIDVSERVAELLGFKRAGRADVRVQYLEKAPLDGDDEKFLLASYSGPQPDVRAGGEVVLASAAPARPPQRAAAKPPILLAVNSGPADDLRAARPIPIAFAPGESGDEDLVAMRAVTSAYDADARIVMAFEMVEADY